MSDTEETTLSSTDNTSIEADSNDKTVIEQTNMNSTEILEELRKKRRGLRISFTHLNKSCTDDLGIDPSLPFIEELYKGLKTKY